jgi:hypothetical protein
MAVDDPLETLSARQADRNGTGPVIDQADARNRLEAMLGLDKAGIHVKAVHLFGTGAEATLRIDLTNGAELRFEPADSMVRPQTVSARVALTVGVAVHLKQPQCVEAASLARQLAVTAAHYTEVDQAREWETEFLQAAETIEFDSRDQAHRFAAFKMLAGRNPFEPAVLRDTDGARLVRSGWFLDYVRSTAPRVSHKHLPTLMHEAGWMRPKRIKATAPLGARELIWTFYVVPADWNPFTCPATSCRRGWCDARTCECHPADASSV